MEPQSFQDWLRHPPESRRPLVMGVLNVTPDSFSDAGRFAVVDAAFAEAEEMIAADDAFRYSTRFFSKTTRLSAWVESHRMPTMS